MTRTTMTDPLDALPLSDKEKRLIDKAPDSDRVARLAELQTQLDRLASQPDNADEGRDELKAAVVSLEMAGILLDIDRPEEAWQLARPTVEIFVALEAFEDAALACQYIYLADREDALPAIGQAAWLSVTYPVDPHLTANILNHIIDETPDDSDGAAVAAAAAHFVVDHRSTDSRREELRLFTGANLARVAKRHSNVASNTEFELWVERMELDDPQKFLVRLRNVIEVLVQSDWWFDRQQLQSKIPD